jgi:hypothetical protein
MAMGQRADHGEGVPLWCDDDATLEHPAQALDVSSGPIGEVAEGTLTHLAAFAVALTQENGRRRVPVRDGFDIHGDRGSQEAAPYKSKD